MNHKGHKLSGPGILLIGVMVLITSYLLSSFFFFFLGTILMIFGAITIILIQALLLFKKDKELNIEQLKEAGLTIVTCPNCLKNNVLEDKYCIYCGEKLEQTNDDL